LDVIARELEARPSVDIIHLSLGGNDFLREWRKEMPEQDREALFSRIVQDIETVVRHCLSVRPNIRVAIVNYDYINQPKGKATLQELNEAGMLLARKKMELAQRLDRCEYIQNYGLMQYCFGYPPDLKPHEVPYPGQAPDFVPFPGGNRAYGNPPEAMLDRIHLSPKGYRYLADHCLKVLYAKWLAQPLPAAEPIQAAAR
jgi:lysophospholipase L1-like esterase